MCRKLCSNPPDMKVGEADPVRLAKKLGKLQSEEGREKGRR